MRITPFSTLTAVAALVAAGAAAQTIELEEIVVSADRAPTAAERTGSAVSVITEEAFEEDGRPFALDFLTEEPGVTVAQSGPPGTLSGFSVRGVPQQYVRVQIDGIEISDPTAPQVTPSLSGFLVDDLSRIEVVRGSQSALYGGQAVGGVIDITTRRATRDGVEADYRIEGGSFSTYRGSVGVAGRDARGEFALNVSRLQTDGFSAAEEADGNSEDDGFETTQISASGRFAASDTISLFASGFYLRGDGDYDNGPGAGQDADNTFASRSWGLRGGAEVDTGALSNTLALSLYSVDRTDEAFGTVSSTDGERAKVEYLGRFSVSERLALQVGADLTEETADTSFSAGSSDNSIAGAFVQADWSPVEPLTVNAALRYDDHSEFGGFPTGRLTAAYRLPTDTILRASAGTGFRAPSIFELFDAFSGNPDLDPETSRSADVGIEQRLAGGRGRVAATAFWLEIDDLIAFEGVFPPPTFECVGACQYVQTEGSAESRGFELSGRWDLTDEIALGSAYTYTDATDATGNRRVRIPRHALAVSLRGNVTDRIDLGIAVSYAGDLPDEPGIESEGFHRDYTVASARVGYALSDAAELYVRAENLLDSEYQTAKGYSTADRSFYFGVAGTF